MAKPIDLEFMVAGIAHRKEQYEKAELASGDLLTLEPEPTNQYDPNAIKILKNGNQIGYVPRNLCANVLLRISSGVKIKMEVINAWSKGCSVKLSSE